MKGPLERGAGLERGATPEGHVMESLFEAEQGFTTAALAERIAAAREAGALADLAAQLRQELHNLMRGPQPKRVERYIDNVKSVLRMIESEAGQ